MLDTATIQRFENALLVGPPSGLRELVEKMTEEGLSQAAICYVFDLFGRYLRAAGRDDEAGLVWVLIECIVGWKSRSSWLFDHFLTQQEYYDYLRSIDAPLRPLFYADRELYHHDA
jgi:hypothetical protein